MVAPPSRCDFPTVVASLLGSGQVATAIPCLASLLRCSAEPLRLRLHDDGSLTAADRDRLGAALGDFDLVSRPEAEERLAELLAPYPAARSFRRGNPLGLKLFDVTLSFPGEAVAYCDTDVLFLRPFRGLFARPPGCGALVMSDVQNAYTVRSWHRLRHPRLRLVGRVNTGVLAFDRRSFDLDRLEWFFARPELLLPAAWAEQTAWALLAARAGCRLVDPAQLRIPTRDGRLDLSAVGFHLVSPVRQRLGELLARLPETRSEAPVAIRSHPAAPCGALRLFAGELRRRARRGVGSGARDGAKHPAGP